MAIREGQHSEDQFTTAIEHQTAQLPSTIYLGLAIGSMAVSAILKLARKNHEALFVGQWAAPFLLMGIYNKMVKQHGSSAGQQNQRLDSPATERAA
jgi:hypothetical protein